jgi:TM2 domain-containing membrane protein YozV
MNNNNSNNNDHYHHCLHCGKAIVSKRARFCEKCGTKIPLSNENPLNNENDNLKINKSNKDNMIRYHKNPYLATLISIFPGIGQMYNGQVLKGIIIKIIWQILIIIGSIEINITGMAIMLVIFSTLWIYNLADAYRNAKDINENNGNYFYNENLKPHIPSNNSDNITDKFQKIDIKVNSFFHHVKNGKKIVSIGKVAILILLLSIFSILIN